MLFASISTLAVTLLAATLPAVQGSALEERASTNCKTILKGYLVGFDLSTRLCKSAPRRTFLTGWIDDKQFRFTTNSAHEVAYTPGWNTSKTQLYVNFQVINTSTLYFPSKF